MGIELPVDVQGNASAEVAPLSESAPSKVTAVEMETVKETTEIETVPADNPKKGDTNGHSSTDTDANAAEEAADIRDETNEERKERSVRIGGTEVIGTGSNIDGDEGEDDDDDDEDDEDVEFESDEDAEDGGEDDDDNEEDINAIRDAAKSGITAKALSHLLSKDCLHTKALLAAAGADDADAVKKLLDPTSEYKVDVNVKDAFNYTALHVAAERGAVNAISALVEASASLEMPTKMYNCRPLHYGKSTHFAPYFTESLLFQLCFSNQHHLTVFFFLAFLPDLIFDYGQRHLRVMLTPPECW